MTSTLFGLRWWIVSLRGVGSIWTTGSRGAAHCSAQTQVLGPREKPGDTKGVEMLAGSCHCSGRHGWGHSRGNYGQAWRKRSSQETPFHKDFLPIIQGAMSPIHQICPTPASAFFWYFPSCGWRFDPPSWTYKVQFCLRCWKSWSWLWKVKLFFFWTNIEFQWSRIICFLLHLRIFLL